MNRLSGYFEEAPKQDLGDYFVVSVGFGVAYVTHDTAAQIEEVLGRERVPEWIVFNDLAGSRYRVRTTLIRSIVESTVAQRAEDRRFDRARQREENEDRRPWEEND